MLAGTYAYTFACLPETIFSINFYCHLYITAQAEASITVGTYYGNTSFTLLPGAQYHEVLDSALHPTQGAENKAVRVTSDVEVQVLVYGNSSEARFLDMYMVPNNTEYSGTYFTSAYFRSSDFQCGSDVYKYFYVVACLSDETSVHVVQQDGTVYMR